MDKIGRWEREMRALLRAMPRETYYGAWPNADVTAADLLPTLQMWVEEEVQQRPTVRDLTGLLLETGGGVAVTLLAHRAISVHLSVPSQALANSVLATLCGKSCLPSACYNGELLTRDWGDVRSIRVMRARCEPAAIHISLDTLYDTTLDCTTGTAH